MIRQEWRDRLEVLKGEIIVLVEEWLRRPMTDDEIAAFWCRREMPNRMEPTP
jgi:hypothetical protein